MMTVIIDMIVIMIMVIMVLGSQQLAQHKPQGEGAMGNSEPITLLGDPWPQNVEFLTCALHLLPQLPPHTVKIILKCTTFHLTMSSENNRPGHIVLR